MIFSHQYIRQAFATGSSSGASIPFFSTFWAHVRGAPHFQPRREPPAKIPRSFLSTTSRAPPRAEPCPITLLSFSTNSCRRILPAAGSSTKPLLRPSGRGGRRLHTQPANSSPFSPSSDRTCLLLGDFCTLTPSCLFPSRKTIMRSPAFVAHRSCKRQPRLGSDLTTAIWCHLRIKMYIMGLTRPNESCQWPS